MHGPKNWLTSGCIEHQGKHILLAGLNGSVTKQVYEKSELILYFGEVVVCSYMLDMCMKHSHCCAYMVMANHISSPQ